MVQPTTPDENAELATQARTCPAMRRAVLLASWFGEGRDLAADGRLRSEDVSELSELLDIDADGFQDSDQFYLAFSAADTAGFLEFSPDFDRARRSVRTADWEAAGEDALLARWQETLFEVAGIEADGQALAADVDGLGVLLVLQLLFQSSGDVGIEEIHAEAAKARQELFGRDDPGGGLGGGLGEIPGGDTDEETGEEDDRPSAFDLLLGFGAIRLGGDGASLTALGRWVAQRVADLVAAGAIQPDEDVSAVIGRLLTMPEDAALRLAEPWLTARNPEDSARLLLSYAAATDPFRRMITLMLARSLGPGAAPAWSEWADRPGVGAYARIWLREAGATTPQSPAAHAGDAEWITVDVCASALSTAPDRATARDFLTEQGIVDSAEAMLNRIDGIDHPNAGDVMEFLRSFS